MMGSVKLQSLNGLEFVDPRCQLINNISLPIKPTTHSASLASNSGKINSVAVQTFPVLWGKHYGSLPARVRFIERGPVLSVSATDGMTEVWKANTSTKCGASILKRKPKEIQASAKNDTIKTENESNSFNSSILAPLCNKLHASQILIYPLITESAMKNIIENNTLVFMVDIRASKTVIKDTFEVMFNIKIKKVNTLKSYHGTKKAFLTLMPDNAAADVAKKFGIMLRSKDMSAGVQMSSTEIHNTNKKKGDSIADA